MKASREKGLIAGGGGGRGGSCGPESNTMDGSCERVQSARLDSAQLDSTRNVNDNRSTTSI